MERCMRALPDSVRGTLLERIVKMRTPAHGREAEEEARRRTALTGAAMRDAEDARRRAEERERASRKRDAARRAREREEETEE